MKFDYLKNISELENLYKILTADDNEESAFSRCLKYGKGLDELIRYTYSKRFPNYKIETSNLYKMIKEKEFKNFLEKTEYYNEIHFIYLASCNATFDDDIDKETAELALANLKDITYRIFSKLNSFDEKQMFLYAYSPRMDITLTEEKTREIYIDVDLKNAGYSIIKEKGKIVPNKVCIEIEVHNLPNQDIGYVDYVIYNRVGNPIAVIEAKKTSKSEEDGAQQARDYADALVENLNLNYRPIIYYTNGYVIKIQDRLGYPARIVGNFASIADLELLIKRQLPGIIDKRKPIVKKTVDSSIIDRSKLIEATKEMIDSMNIDGKMRRKGLIVLPCGVGKTRTAVALTKILIENDWVQNVLFLADRNNLVDNALKPFQKYINGVVSDISAENKDRDINARICLCTYNSMLNFLNKPKKEFSVGHFDLIFVDEAHRTLFNVYRSIFEYFDSFVIGLTATPSKALDRSTYEILDLRTDEPTYELKFEDAVNLEYLVSYRAFDKTSNIMKNGLRYNDLTGDEKRQYEKLFTDEDGNLPEEINGKRFYKEIFNNDTIDRMFSDLFQFGLRVENGNKIGKTLVFAVDHKHACMIADRFKHNYPHLGDDFCQVIDNQIVKNKTRQQKFAIKSYNPQIVISVNMMDTGVDIPEIVNLVFFKKVLSRIKFDQMWGRGTRTCKNLKVITPSREYFEGRSTDDTRSEYLNKQGFFIFDYCNNFEYFDLHPEGNDPSVTLNLNQKIFSTELDILVHLQDINYQEKNEYRAYYNRLKMNLVKKIDNLDINRIDVKSKQQYVDKYKNISSFDNLTQNNIFEIKTYLLKLIDTDSVDDNYRKSFDYKVYIIQLSLLDTKINSIKQQKQIYDVALALLKKVSIADIYEKKDLLKELANDEYYESLDFFKLEDVKKEIGPLVQYLSGEESGNKISDFNDSIETTELDVKYDFESFKPFREKFVSYLKKHYGELISVQKIFKLEQLNKRDLEELQRILNSLKDENTSDKELFSSNTDLIIFIRKIIGMDRSIIDKKCAEFLNMNNFNSKQRQLLNLVIDFAIHNGNVSNSDLVNSEPFTEFEIPDIFNNDINPILNITNLFSSSLQING